MSNDTSTDRRVPLSDGEKAAVTRRREALHRAVTELDAELDAFEQGLTSDGGRFETALGDLVTTLAQHIEETDAPDGLLGQILEVAPWFGPRVEQLRREHDVLHEQASALLEQVASGQEPDQALGDVRELSARVDEHRHRGTTLLLDAYMLDIPAGD
ncbi:MAG: hypothetical protein EA387_09910 [Nitriliruptor sp.]|nr:MAG: hypothetical protein EA387_09910 [Nitriliruptor sp.]